MDLLVKKAKTSKIIHVYVKDVSDGSGKTGLVYDSAGLTCYYMREGATVAVAVSLVNIVTLGTYVSGGFKEVSAANMPGEYEFHPPNAALATGADSVKILLKGVSGMVPAEIKIQLTSFDPNDGVRMGLTSLHNAAAGSASGAPTRDNVQTEAEDALRTYNLNALIQHTHAIDSAGSTVGVILHAGSPGWDTDELKGATFVFTSGALSGQSRRIRSNDVSTDQIVLDRDLTAVPGGDPTFAIIAVDGLLLEDVQEEAEQAARIVLGEAVAEPSAAMDPPTSPSLLEAASHLYMAAFRQRTSSKLPAGEAFIHNAAGTAIFRAALSDSNGLFTRAVFTTASGFI